MWRLFALTDPTTGQVVGAAQADVENPTECWGLGEPLGADAATPVLTLADFQRLPLPPGEPTVQPPGGRTLVNVDTNVYVEAEPIDLDTELLGFPVEVRATPVRYEWDFGDGGTLGPTEDTGAPYPDLRLTHVYEDAGAHEITLTTYYAGEFSVAGGPFLPVDGEAVVTSDPIPIEVLAGVNRLVAEPAP